MDPYKHQQISLNPDGSLTRNFKIPAAPPTGDRNSTAPALSKDVPLNPTHNTWLRIFLPNNTHQLPPKLPVILYFHGGGFVLGSAADDYLHSMCETRTAKIPAIAISVEYRLAPEHRLPAAYDDALDALLWVRDQARRVDDSADPWLKSHADFSSLFIMGNSAGANIAYHLAVRSLDLDLGPLEIRGLILMEPYFGGEERTESEARSTDDKIIPLAVNDLYWELALPTGADRDHEYSNPKAGAIDAERRKGLPRCLVRGFVGDPLYDRQREFVRMLEEEGASVVALMEDEGFHGIELFDPSKFEMVTDDCRRFIYGDGGGEK